MRNGRFILFISIITILFIALFNGQRSSAANNISADSQSDPTQITANISFNVNANGTNINSHILGTNLPAWLGPHRTENSTFANRTKVTQSHLFRIPGGSWSNGYDWVACETGDYDNCSGGNWGLTPSDFINFLDETNSQGMYTVNMNETSKKASALVAFFNGSVNDDKVIGTDVTGFNWGKVSDWAKLRRDHGHPEPYYIKYWEIGNEIYGGKENHGKDCVSWGWENVWTCDGTEYVNGKGSHEGFTAFRNAMRAVDPSIMVGAVGIPYGNSPNWWVNYNNWGNEVIAAAGNHMDFYIIHQYAFGSMPDSYQDALSQPQSTWQAIKADIDASFDNHANGRRVPIAITEYNMFSTESDDDGNWMPQAVNLLFMADTIGQMMTHEFDIANQWDLANGAKNGTDYGMLHADTFSRYPQYYAIPMWARFGSTMLPISSSHNAATELSVYAGRIDPWTVSVMAINKTGHQISTSIALNGAPDLLLGGTADVVKANSLSSTSVALNGNSNPNDSLSNAPATNLGVVSNPMAYTFEPYSVTLLRLEIAAFEPTDWVYLPSIIND